MMKTTRTTVKRIRKGNRKPPKRKRKKRTPSGVKNQVIKSRRRLKGVRKRRRTTINMKSLKTRKKLEKSASDRKPK